MSDAFPTPPKEELTDKPAPVRRKVARAAAFKVARAAAAPRKSVLIINDNDSAYSDESQSVAIFMSAFKALGYDVNLEKSENTSYTTWKNYDIVVWSCSDDYSAVSEDKYKQMLIKYVVSGGQLILESGNVAGWNKEEGVTTLDRRFREQVLYATDDWVYHDVGDLKLKTNHPIATTPNMLPKTISFTPTDPGDESGDANAIRILPGAIGIFNWSYVAYDGNHVNDDIENNSYGLIACNVSAENGGRIIYFAFDIDDIADPDIQQKLIQNSENWLSQKPSIPPRDDPFGRHEELKLDRIKGSEGQKLAILRLTALEHARKMPKAEEEVRIETMQPTPGISNWVQMGPATIAKGQTDEDPKMRVLVTGRVTAIIVDPTDSDIIYIGAAQGGIWKTTDGGKNWIPTSDNEDSLSIGALAMDPTNHLVLYAGTGEGNFSGDSFEGSGVLKTTDGGATWTLQGKNDFAGARFCRIAVDHTTPSNIFAATFYGVYRSTDGGTSWTLMTGGLPPVTTDGTPIATDVVIDPTTPSTVYAAFYGLGIYKTNDADADNPTWERLNGGLPPSGNFQRIALGISPSSPQTLYALMADVYTDDPDTDNVIDKFYFTTDSGTTWNSITLQGGNIYGQPVQPGTIGGQGDYNLNVAVDPTTSDLVYLSGILLWKVKRNSTTDEWEFTNIGHRMHPDNHAFAFDPTNHLIIYAGNDGGVYKSTDGGDTWTDTINKGLCITQFEFIDHNPNSNAVVCGGTQDNGTEQFRNSPVFYHSKEGDGGFVAIDQNDPKNMLSTYTRLTPQYSNQGGQFESWNDVSDGLSGESLFYPPMTFDQSNPNNAAIGGSKLFLDDKQGNGGWQTSVTLPGMKGLVSAINYVNSNLIYVGTTNGEVYCLTKSGDIWTRTAIHDSSLPQGWIWDVGIRPDDSNTIIVVMAEHITHHVWRGEVSANISATWTDISANLPNTPVYSLVIDSDAPDTMYIGTEVGVFRTTNGGTSWIFFSEGLPTVAVYDMRLHSPTRLLRAVTHGRGMWERKLDATSMPDVNIYMRSNLMDTRRVLPTPSKLTAAFDDPLQHVALGDQLSWDQCADIKIDVQGGSTSDYQMNVVDVDYVAFESILEHKNPHHHAVNRIYVQVHNRGIKPATDVTVKILYADASQGYPDLPSDFWTAFPGDSTDTSQWMPIGSAEVIKSLLPTQPVVLEWDWNTPTTVSNHSCLLVVTDCPDDTIPPENKVFNIDALVPKEKHVGLRKLDVV